MIQFGLSYDGGMGYTRGVSGVLSALLLVATSGCGSGPGRVRTHRDLVKAGMSSVEVQEVLGEPADKWVKEEGNTSVWLYRYRAHSTANIFGVIVGIILISALVVLLVAAASAGGGGGHHFGGFRGWGGGGGRGGATYFEFEVHFDVDGRVYGVTEIKAPVEP